MIRRQKLPELSHIETIEGYPVFVTMQGRLGIVFRVPSIDLESEQGPGLGDIEQILHDLPPGILLRCTCDLAIRNQVLGRGPRAEAVAKIGFLERRLTVSFEADNDLTLFQAMRGNSWRASARSLLHKCPIQKVEEIGGEVLSEDDIRKLFGREESEYERRFGCIDVGRHLIGAVRLWEPGSKPVAVTKISEILGHELPRPLYISVTAVKKGHRKTEYGLRSKANVKRSSKDFLDQVAAEQYEQALERTQFGGDEHAEVEWIALLERESEEILRRDREVIRRGLSQLGSVCAEVPSIETAYVATRHGARQHVTFTEYRSHLPAYLPTHFYGERKLPGEIPIGAVILHRLDGSPYVLDQFGNQNKNFNLLLSGASGEGKSVFLGMHTVAVHDNPDTRIIKVDVAGSYERECELLEGEQITFDMTKPSGLDPFVSAANSGGINDAAEVLKTLVAALLKEPEEKSLPKTLLADIEAVAMHYVTKVRAKEVPPGIDSFYELAKSIERGKVLGRWVKGGIYENAFKKLKKDRAPARYTYFNFKDIYNAQCADYSDGVMAAVMAEVNLEIVRIGRTSKERLEFDCDEVRFFITRHYEALELLAANFRKFGHTLLLVLQDLRQIDRKQGNADDQEAGIWPNMQIRVYFRSKLPVEYLRSRQLSEREIAILVGDSGDRRDAKIVIVQDGAGSRAVRIIQTAEEYWRSTTDKTDNVKLHGVLQAVPGLTTDEAIRCLATVMDEQ
jgi:hypothetical protein